VLATKRLSHGSVSLRRLNRFDFRRLNFLLLTERDWLEPWEATVPGPRRPIDVKWLVRSLISQSKQGSAEAFVIEFDSEVVGQLNVANILYGSVSSATVGYWISKEYAGRGITPTAVALAIDYLINDLGLHRVEIDIRPENKPSLRVVEKLGLRHEGTKKRYIHINGRWCDHEIFAITQEEIFGSMLKRL
jgi:[ribosomal protein S5]-alanine N-acetyltransferase